MLLVMPCVVFCCFEFLLRPDFGYIESGCTLNQEAVQGESIFGTSEDNPLRESTGDRETSWT